MSRIINGKVKAVKDLFQNMMETGPVYCQRCGLLIPDIAALERHVYDTNHSWFGKNKKEDRN